MKQALGIFSFKRNINNTFHATIVSLSRYMSRECTLLQISNCLVINECVSDLLFFNVQHLCVIFD
jgi:hypothetical protein